MNRFILSAFAILTCLSQSSSLMAQNNPQQGVTPVSEPSMLIQLPNAKQPAPGLLTGGQPTEADLQAAAAAGYKTVINLRPGSEMAGIDESGQVESLGMHFISIPIGGAADLTEENARRLDRAMAPSESMPVIIHCASGNRVGALLALRANLIQGKSASEALAFGKAAGLTTLEDAVKQRLK
ncbi:MAG: protein tyrosine phosphatase family protein [Candidatus Macondimonas sp.]|jgi:uncharacterized protein (TIGR01244 family)